MADNKKKNPSLITPPLLLKYPRLTTPDTRYNEDGEYSTKALGDPNDATVQAFLKKLDKAVDDAMEAIREEKADDKKVLKLLKRTPAYRMELDKEGEETGKVEFNFKMPAKITAKKGKNAGKTYTFKPALFDAKGNVVPVTARIGGGTIAKIAFEFWPYFSAKDKDVGITRRLTAVQIIKLVEWSSERDASDFGFGEEEGFSALESADTSVSSGATDDSDDDTETGNAGDF